MSLTFVFFSLENMYKELASDIEGFEHPRHGDLTGWAQQGIFANTLWVFAYQKRYFFLDINKPAILWLHSSGVLLLNAVLTVRAHQANSHKDRGWETFTDSVIHWLSSNLEGLVFMLWGSYAQKKGAAINRVRHSCGLNTNPSNWCTIIILIMCLNCVSLLSRNAIMSCRLCTLLPCLLTEAFLDASISQRPMSC